MSSITKLNDLLKNNIFGQTAQIPSDLYSVITAINGLNSANNAVKVEQSKLYLFGTDNSSEKYQEAKKIYDGKVKEKTLQKINFDTRNHCYKVQYIVVDFDPFTDSPFLNRYFIYDYIGE